MAQLTELGRRGRGRQQYAGGVVAGLVAAQPFSVPPAVTLVVGGLTGVLVLAAHLRYQVLRWRCARALTGLARPGSRS